MCGSMTSQFKLVPKMQDNQAIIYLVLPSGNTIEMVWIVFPNDKQVNDNCEALNEIVKILTKRIRRSI